MLYFDNMVHCEEATCSDASESILEEEQENHQKKLLPLSVTPEVCVYL